MFFRKNRTCHLDAKLLLNDFQLSMLDLSLFLFAAKVVFSSYANLHRLLADADQQLLSIEDSKRSILLDSHIIGASFAKKSQSQNSANPSVQVTLEHFNENPMPRICVFWDIDEETWSDYGCEVIGTNLTHTQCSCQHMAWYGILAIPEDQALVGNGLDFGLIQDEKKEAHKDINTVITVEIATYLVSSICLLIIIILLIQVCYVVHSS